MKKFSAVILSLAVCGVMLSACGNNGGTDTSLTDSQTSAAAEEEGSSVETTEAETETETEPETESETEIETETDNSSETETSYKSKSEVDEIIENNDIEEMMKIIGENSKTVGNDTAGYMTVYFGDEYEEYDDGNFTVTSEDGKRRIFTELYPDMQPDLVQTAYMFCLTVAMNSEIDGYETYNINNVSIDGMEGCFAVMIDSDTDLGFKLYAAFADTENGMIRALGCECSDFTEESLISSSVVFDSYRRSDNTE